MHLKKLAQMQFIETKDGFMKQHLDLNPSKPLLSFFVSLVSGTAMSENDAWILWNIVAILINCIILKYLSV